MSHPVCFSSLLLNLYIFYPTSIQNGMFLVTGDVCKSELHQSQLIKNSTIIATKKSYDWTGREKWMGLSSDLLQHSQDRPNQHLTKLVWRWECPQFFRGWTREVVTRKVGMGGTIEKGSKNKGKGKNEKGKCTWESMGAGGNLAQTEDRKGGGVKETNGSGNSERTFFQSPSFFSFFNSIFFPLHLPLVFSFGDLFLPSLHWWSLPLLPCTHLLYPFHLPFVPCFLWIKDVLPVIPPLYHISYLVPGRKKKERGYKKEKKWEGRERKEAKQQGNIMLLFGLINKGRGCSQSSYYRQLISKEHTVAHYLCCMVTVFIYGPNKRPKKFLQLKLFPNLEAQWQQGILFYFSV